MLNRAIAKLVLIAFWGMFFQCQAVGAVSPDQQAQSPHSQESKKGFCKKKLIDDQQKVSAVTAGQTDQKRPPQPLDSGYLGQFVDYLIASLQPASTNVGVHFYPSNRWSAALYRANPNKAPPRSLLA